MSAAKILEVQAGLQRDAQVDGTIGVANCMPPEDVIRLVQSAKVNHIVQKDNLFFDAEMLIAKAMIAAPKDFITDPLAFLFESVFKAEGPIDAIHDQSLNLTLVPTDKKIDGALEV